MKTVIIHGQDHKGSSYYIGRLLADKVADDGEIVEFFLPRDLNGFCTGCCACIKDEALCPFRYQKKAIADAMDEAELLIFTTPTYCLECSAPLKAFIDLFYQYWIPHRPRASMFKKKAVVISTAAGIGAGKAIAPVKRTLTYWGVPYIKTYGVAVHASGRNEMSAHKKRKIEKKMTALAAKLKAAKAGKPKLFIRLLFALMASSKRAAKKNDYDFYEAIYWRNNGWLDGERPWNVAEPAPAQDGEGDKSE